MSMGISRMLDQNVYFWVTSGLNHGIPGEVADQDWTSVKVVAGYPNNVDDLALPTVAVVRDSQSDTPLELGSSRNIIRTDTYVLSVFASRDGQRDDLAEFLKTIVDQRTKTFLDFNDGFAPEGGQSSLGIIDFEFIGMAPVRNLDSQKRANMHRMDIRFNTEYTYTT